MSTLRVKKSFLRQVNVDDVMEELKADNYFFMSHCEMMACVKDTPAFKQMQEVAFKPMFNTLENTALPDKDAREEKKQQIAKIGLLARQINSSISELISERLKQEAAVTVKRALKKLSVKRSECSDSLSNKGRKRKQNDVSSEISLGTKRQKKKSKEEDSESDVSLDGISESVSSVHTSDLSSFDDEIIISSEDEKGVKKEKRISFRTANKAYFGGGFSNIRNVVGQRDNASEASEESKTEKKSLPNASKKFEKSENSTSRPKRERKPNSKYSE